MMNILKEECIIPGQKVNLNDAIQNYYDNRSKENHRKLMEAGHGLILHFALLYNGGVSNDDYMQVGFEGLLKAIQRFDPERKTSFVTYAGHCILGEIRHLYRKEASYYRPNCISNLQSKADHFIQESVEHSDRLSSIQEVAFHINVKDNSIPEVMRAGLIPLHDLHIENISCRRQESFQLPIEDRILLSQAIHHLSDAHKKVISLLFFKEMTQQQVAEVLGCNQRKVSRLLKAGLKKLHDFIER